MQLKLNKVDGYTCEAFADMASVEPHWRALETDRTQPFARFAWASACTIAQEKKGWSPLILVFFKGEDPQMILPLQVQDFGLFRRARWLCDRLSDYNTSVLANGLGETMAAKLSEAALCALKGAPWRIDAFHLLRQPAELGDESAPPLGRMIEEAEHGSHVLSLCSDWKSLFAGLRSSRSRKRLREKHKALGKLGTVSFRQIRNPAQCKAVAHQIMRWKSDQLDDRGSRNPFEGETGQLRQVITSVLDNETSATRVYGLFVGGRLIAGMIAFATRQSFSMLVTAYDPQASAKTSPGTTVLLKTMELAARAGISNYDHLYGDEPYKTEWSDRRIAMSHGYVPLTPAGWADCLFAVVRLRIKKAIMQQPAALAAINRARRWTKENASTGAPLNAIRPRTRHQHPLNAASGD